MYCYMWYLTWGLPEAGLVHVPRLLASIQGSRWLRVDVHTVTGTGAEDHTAPKLV